MVLLRPLLFLSWTQNPMGLQESYRISDTGSTVFDLSTFAMVSFIINTRGTEVIDTLINIYYTLFI
jgi:hypothetical protein